MLGGGALVAARFVKSPAQAAAEAAPPVAGPVTAPVERRVMRNTVVVRGKVAPSRSTLITYPGAGTGGKPVITRLPLKSGAEVRSGAVVAEVSGRPIIVLQGTSPAYRDMAPGTRGDDVKQLQSALAALGHPTNPDPAGLYGDATKKAVAALYAKAGYQIATASADEDAGLRAAERRVRDARIALQRLAGADPAAIEDARRVVRDAEEDLAELRGNTGAVVPIGEAVFIETLPARITKVGVVVGDDASSELVTVASGDLIVRGGVGRADASLVRQGQRVQIASEVLGSGVSGKVDRVGLPESTGATEGEEKQSTTGPPGQLEVVVIPDTPLEAKFDGQDVRLTVESASTEGEVLVVPLAAVSARADGQSQVVRVRPEGEERIPVTPGVSGAATWRSPVICTKATESWSAGEHRAAGRHGADPSGRGACRGVAGCGQDVRGAA
ncbi:hypothetical protein Aglo01_31890 [Actinokineospora globicatena]|nr:hypothetical protein Aglo01_31890 [Actinokineospora globicatena]